MTYKIGDIVEYRASFLRSCGMYTNVPSRGRVVAVKPTYTLGADMDVVSVRWPGQAKSMRILSANLIHRNRMHLEV